MTFEEKEAIKKYIGYCQDIKRETPSTDPILILAFEVKSLRELLDRRLWDLYMEVGNVARK